MSIDQTWKVGALAEASGLTVRTLHHWDGIGLLSPSRRGAGGHREYTEQDVVRLYQVLALRRLGLGLESIATCLDAGVDPVRLVGDHLAQVTAAVAGLERQRQRLAQVHGELLGEHEPQIETLLDVLRAMDGAGPEREQALRRHLDGDQLRAMGERVAALGPAAHYLVEVELPELYRRAEALRLAGSDHGDPKVRQVVRRVDELSALLNGGDPALSAGVRAAWQAEPAVMSGDPAAPAEGWPELTVFLARARELAAGLD
ncbi:MerR family transcriptional regulator [Kitasatospora sp. NBC_01266]|uniref:MerR family transcriptional regulator n=1 Tax=Kitasatospora sp. NBC_01266 TaxID=2903572 RepID=UPI002E36BF78|nr:MerR family transcriptional regulator [Kitasatospora sp. NBC_01266]